MKNKELEVVFRGKSASEIKIKELMFEMALKDNIPEQTRKAMIKASLQ